MEYFQESVEMINGILATFDKLRNSLKRTCPTSNFLLLEDSNADKKLKLVQRYFEVKANQDIVLQ